MNYLYLLHFKTKHRHCQHYLGATTNFNSRMKTHFSGRGSKLVRHVLSIGIEVTLGRVWMFADARAAFQYEKLLKRTRNHRRCCEICNGRAAYEEMEKSLSALLSTPKPLNESSKASKPDKQSESVKASKPYGQNET